MIKSQLEALLNSIQQVIDEDEFRKFVYYLQQYLNLNIR